MKLLTSEPRSRVSGIGWSERNVMQLFQQFETAFKMRLSKDAQTFFAMPEAVGDDRIDFYTEDYKTAVKYADQRPDTRKEIDGRIEAIVNEIEAFRQGLADSGDSNNRNIALALEKAFRVPSRDAIWIVDGAPVVTLWGFQSDGASLDLRSIKIPKKDKPVAGGPDDAGRNRKRLLFGGLALLLLLLGLLALLFGPALLCDFGLRACNAPIAQEDRGVLPDGVVFVDVNVVANDSDPDGDPITIAGCDAPGIVRDDQTVRFARDPAQSSGEVRFSCTVQDPSGLTDAADVVIAVGGQGGAGAGTGGGVSGTAPSARTVSAILPPGEPSVSVDVLSGVVNGGNRVWQVVGCDAPGVVENGRVTYPRNPDDTVQSETFDCRVQSDDGLTLTVPVEVAREANRCTPFTTNLPVRLLIGADWSSSMDQNRQQPPHNFSRMLDALEELRTRLPAETFATLELMRGEFPVDLRTDGAAFLSDPTANGRPTPRFAAYIEWLRQEIQKAGTDFSLITVVTITDAQDNPEDFLAQFEAAFQTSRVPIEHTLITLTEPKPQWADLYQRMVWPPDETRNYRELLDAPAQSRLPSEILQAARMVVREECGTP
ncbi:hypothetical protein SAMN05216376_105337 [Mameliella alba]|uniref:Ig-like domain-containing protein n=1 Tax=Mameliella alba TaxID=561184 RepID=UPI00088AECDE|nr:Ig-like domain-containing protein [Mameliella alba]OWV48374.1 hypothetical protein CDZ96_11230 [Mameliella alba]PTR40425.1 hypothetical protein LX94_01909 [Mameliella alba]GGF44857.1 hypothetical protein GCM10011319_03360 [Mameliella alba]SDD02616.1 hypothetical protein SAMN05216376_105337 [Mameliella alba]